MQDKFSKKIINFIKTEKRFFLALVFLGVVFLINQALYLKKTKTVQSCAEGKCLMLVGEKPQLTKEQSDYWVEDLFTNQPAGYYRLTFQAKSAGEEKILLKLSDGFSRENQIAELNFSPADKFQNQEVLFLLPEGFRSFVFQKADPALASEIFIENVSISKLDVTAQSELSSLKKTLVGETDTQVLAASQSVSNQAFSQLKESKAVLGQVFQAKTELISAVALKINLSNNLNPGSRQYTLSLREVNYDGKNIAFSGPIITDLAFSLSSIEKYRQADGAFLFPLFGRLEKTKYYLVSLDNSKVDVSAQNYLEVLGDTNGENYAAGSAVVRKNKELTLTSGDLYFKIYGADLAEENGVPILNGAKIEDLGRGLGRYSYTAKGKYVDLFDLETAAPGTEFSENDKVIYAPAKDNASFTYAVNTIYPISKLTFSATQLRSGWKGIKVSYSFDRQNWTDLPFSQGSDFLPGFGIISSVDAVGSDEAVLKDTPSTDTSGGATDNSIDGSPDSDVSIGTIGGTVQIFNADIVPAKEARAIYFKITYDQTDKSKGRFFALKNLKIMADLKIKPVSRD